MNDRLAHRWGRSTLTLKVEKKKTWLVQSIEHATPDLKVVEFKPHVCVKPT